MAATNDGQNDSAASEEFVRLIAAEQFRLLHYISMLLGDPHSASNVLQETNLVLWRKASDFEPGTNFTAWAKKVAYWQVQAFVRDRKRERVTFSDELVGELASYEAPAASESELTVALRHCLGKLSKTNIELLRERYEEDTPIAKLSSRLQKTESAIKVQLMRLRRRLLKCIEQRGLSSS